MNKKIASYAKVLVGNLDRSDLPIDPYKIAKSKGIYVIEDDIDSVGMLVVVRDQAIISVSKSIREETRKRFTVAHELGHFCLPGHLSQTRNGFSCNNDDLNTVGRVRGIEAEANEFAAELLMPSNLFPLFLQEDELSLFHLKELAGVFGTSLTSTAIRVVEHSEKLALVCTERGFVKWYVKSPDFPYLIDCPSKLGKGSCARAIYEGESVPPGFEPVPADVWLSGSKVSSETELLELSFPLPSYQQVLSFLSLDQQVPFEDPDEDEGRYEELDGYLRFKKK